MQAIDFRALFEHLPQPYILLDQDMRYVEANRAYCDLMGARREQLLGRRAPELFPPPDAEAERAYDCLRRVFATGEKETVSFLRYAIRSGPRLGGQLDIRYWSLINTPLKDEEGAVRYVLQNVLDVTDLRPLREDPGEAGQPQDRRTEPEAPFLQYVSDVQQTNISLSREMARLRDLFMRSPGFIAFVHGPDLVVTQINEAGLALVGQRPALGRPLADILPELDPAGIAHIKKLIKDRETFVAHGLRVDLVQPNGELEEHYLDVMSQPVIEDDGHVSGALIAGSDVTSRVRAEAERNLLMEELNHRVKNTLANVQAIASQTLRTSPEPEAFRQAFTARLNALAATHDLLNDGRWGGADMTEVLLLELSCYGPERYSLHGPSLELSPGETLSLSLAVHELATNAAKYGALSNETGVVEARWMVEHDASGCRLVLDWKERGGPQVSPPVRRGFGTRLIERSLYGKSRGEAAIAFSPDGVSCRIIMPLHGRTLTLTALSA